MNNPLRPARIKGLGDLSRGNHFGLFYKIEEDLIEILAQYFKQGLEDHEFCLWITSDSTSKKSRNALRQAIPGTDKFLKADDIEIVTYGT